MGSTTVSPKVTVLVLLGIDDAFAAPSEEETRFCREARSLDKARTTGDLWSALYRALRLVLARVRSARAWGTRASSAGAGELIIVVASGGIAVRWWLLVTPLGTCPKSCTFISWVHEPFHALKFYAVAQ